MFSATSRLLSQPGRVITHSEFSQSLQSIWRKWEGPTPHKLGLAISGGVDSMALARLCIDAEAARSRKRYQFKAYVVDHKLRGGSTREAEEVKRTLEGLGIETEILTSSKELLATDIHLETSARNLRYELLGNAVHRDGIRALMLAHHADDQVETMLIRMINKYFGRGLTGIKDIKTIACPITYGITQSGQPRRLLAKQQITTAETDGGGPVEILTEGGGVQILRPLLEFAKRDLIATCTESRTPWFEDPTNKDVSLTVRNTIRYMQVNELLPQALRHERLKRLRLAISARDDHVELISDELLQTIDIRLSLSCAQLSCRVPADTMTRLKTHPDAYKVRQTILERLIKIIAATKLKQASWSSGRWSSFLQPLPGEQVFDFGYIHIRAAMDTSGEYFCSLIPKNPPSLIVHSLTIPNWMIDDNQPTSSKISWSQWRFWDRRYWIRLGQRRSAPGLTSRFVVRPRQPMDDQRRSRDRMALHKAFSRRVKDLDIPLAAAYTLPVIASTDNDDIVAYPSFGLSDKAWTMVEDEQADISESAADYFYMIRFREIPRRYTSALAEKEE